MKTFFFLIAGACMLCAAAAYPADSEPPAPGEKDKCPVCGMFVSPYPAWTCWATLKGGGVLFFDGPKDLFTYLHNTEKYTPGRTRADIAEIRVKGYYRLAPVDAAAALYVIGSDVTGPMGRELVPLASQAEAAEFMKDHQGKKILRSGDITPEVLKSLQ